MTYPWRRPFSSLTEASISAESNSKFPIRLKLGVSSNSQSLIMPAKPAVRTSFSCRNTFRKTLRTFNPSTLLKRSYSNPSSLSRSEYHATVRASCSAVVVSRNEYVERADDGDMLADSREVVVEVKNSAIYGCVLSRESRLGKVMGITRGFSCTCKMRAVFVAVKYMFRSLPDSQIRASQSQREASHACINTQFTCLWE